MSFCFRVGVIYVWQFSAAGALSRMLFWSRFHGAEPCQGSHSGDC